MPGEYIKVLIIDDDPVDREIYKRYLRESSEATFEFAEAASAREGIARCTSYIPDCVLLDYSLPDMNGLEILRSLAGGNGQPRHPIVMLTGIGNERLAVDAMKAGVMDYASKGSASAEMLDHTIRNAVDKFRMQRELEAQRERYRTLLEAIPLMVWSSGPDGAIHFANARWNSYAGQNATDWMELVHPEDRPAVIERWSRALDSASPLETEARVIRQDGKYRWHLLRAVPMPQDQPNRMWLCTATDIADQKDAQQALLQQQKLDSIGLLAGGIAHDFNNLLVGIMGGTSFALEAMPRTHPAHSMLQNVLDASERAAQLTRQMLAYAGKGQFVVERIDLSNLVACTSELARTLIPDSVNLTMETAVDLPPIESDSGQVQQIVMNLLVNAAESIPEETRGSVIVRTSLREIAGDEHASDVWGQPVAAGTYVVLEVQDTGMGMSEETRTKIFDPFFTTKFTGRGLGLAAVQGIVRSNRGAIQVSSTLGKGTSIRVLFPVKPPAAARRSRVESKSKPTAPIGTVLVIDDEAVVRNVVQLALTKSGYAVLCAEAGKQGLAMLDSRPEISAVLLDMSMPEMSGQEVLVELKKRRPDLPVIACSGFNEEEVLRQFAGLDLAGVIQKPFTAQQLMSNLSVILAAQQTTSRTAP